MNFFVRLTGRLSRGQPGAKSLCLCVFFFFVALGGRGKSSKMLFFVGNATTIKFLKCKFYCRELLLSLHRLLTSGSSTELESGNALGAFLQTPDPVMDKISEPMGARFLSSVGLGSGNLIGRAQFPPAPALDKNRSPKYTSHFHRGTFAKVCPPSGRNYYVH